jgi:hypothetical protein
MKTGSMESNENETRISPFCPLGLTGFKSFPFGIAVVYSYAAWFSVEGQ